VVLGCSAGSGVLLRGELVVVLRLGAAECVSQRDTKEGLGRTKGLKQIDEASLWKKRQGIAGQRTQSQSSFPASSRFEILVTHKSTVRNNDP
jgi:hypothetical protein